MTPMRFIRVRPSDTPNGQATMSVTVGLKPDEVIRLHSAWVTLTTDATVADRILELRIQESGANQNPSRVSAAAVPALMNGNLVFGVAGSDPAIALLAAGRTAANHPVPRAVFERDVTVSFVVASGFQLGDQLRFAEICLMAGPLEQIVS